MACNPVPELLWFLVIRILGLHFVAGLQIQKSTNLRSVRRSRSGRGE